MVSNLKKFEEFPKDCGLDVLTLSSRWKPFQIELLISFVLEIRDKLVRMKTNELFHFTWSISPRGAKSQFGGQRRKQYDTGSLVQQVMCGVLALLCGRQCRLVKGHTGIGAIFR